LRANLAGSREEQEIFDRLFAAHFRGEEDAGRPFAGRLRGESMQGSMGHHSKPLDQEVVTPAASFSADTTHHAPDLAQRWDPGAPPLDRVIRELARYLATRPSRRQRPARRGARVDLRQSLRRNARHGLDLVHLAHVEPGMRKTRIVMLCDVSGSMDAFNPFLLRLMFGLQQALAGARTLVFSTHVTEITALLRRRSVVEALRAVGDTVSQWSGGTDIGGALARLNRGILCEGLAGSTVVIIISDGYDNGAPERIAEEMQTLERRVDTVVWINPMYGASTFQVRAAGMKAALPYVAHFLPAFDHRSLRVLVRRLAQV
jgi:uncharacterized protein with von Willebrand factor type A (vWA) domain